MDENTKWIIVSIILFCLVVILIISSIISRFNKKIDKHKSDAMEQQGRIRELVQTITVMQTETKGQAQTIAAKWFTEWKETEWETYKKKADAAGIEMGKIALREWIIEHEAAIRKDTAKRTIAVNMGKMTEHLIPFSEQFKEFNSKDARFIGSPIDLIVFDGVAEKKPLINIYFIEVKTGNSAVSEIQRKIAAAIDNNRVHWKLIRREEFNWKAPDPETP
jgi:predicted Holliday junction resolvase-like endonuclease